MYAIRLEMRIKFHVAGTVWPRGILCALCVVCLTSVPFIEPLGTLLITSACVCVCVNVLITIH